MSTVEIEFGLQVTKAIFIKTVKKLISKINSTRNLKNPNLISLGKATFKNYVIYTLDCPALSNTSKHLRKVETSTGITYESKERLNKEKRGTIELFGNSIPIFLRSSIETQLESKDFESTTCKYDNISRILRLSIPTQYFNVDLSIRYMFDNTKEKFVKGLTLDFNSFLEGIIVPGATMLFDIEFELKQYYVDQIINPTCSNESVVLDMIYSIIVELLTDKNLVVEDLIKNYTKSPQVVTFTNEIIEKSNQDDMVKLLKTDGVRNLMIVTLCKTEFKSYLKFYRWNSLESENIDLIELDESKFAKIKIPKRQTKELQSKIVELTEVLVAIFDCERVNLSKNQIKMLNETKDPYDYYYIFDGYYIQSIEDGFKQASRQILEEQPERKLSKGDIRTCSFEQRMQKIDEWFKTVAPYKVEHKDLPEYNSSQLGTVVYNSTNMNNSLFRVVLKNYETKVVYSELLEVANVILQPIKDGVAEIEFDGYILQLKQPYELISLTQHQHMKVSNEQKVFDLSKTYSFKVKPTRFNTIDFKLKNNNSKLIPSYSTSDQKEQLNTEYQLYVVGSGLDSTYNLKEISRLKTIEKFTDILFSTPFIENTHIYNAEYDSEIEWCVGKRVHPKDVDLNGKIVEMWFDIDTKQWRIHKIRHDKSKPNGYRTAFSNMSLFFDPLRLESYYSPILATFSTDLVDYFHECSHFVRDVMYDKLQTTMYEKQFDTLLKINYLDFAGGRGGDVFKIIDTMKQMSPEAILNLFATDISSTGLVKYAQKVQKLSQSAKRTINLNVIAKPNGDEEQSEILYGEIISRKEFAKFNIINMSFAIHYISDYLEEFVNLCKRLLADDYIIMLTFYDSEDVLANIDKFKVFKDIEIDIKDNKAYMPLPTISSSGYREEPCMSKEHIKFLKDSFEDKCTIYDFNPFFNNNLKVPSTVKDKAGIDDVNLYFSCIRTLIFASEVA